MVYAIEDVKNRPEEVFVTKEELQEVALGKILDTTKGTLENEVHKFIEDKKNSMGCSVNGGLSAVQERNKKKRRAQRKGEIGKATRRMVEWEAEEESGWDSDDSIE